MSGDSSRTMTLTSQPVFRTAACIAMVVAIVGSLYPFFGPDDSPYDTALLSLICVLFVAVYWGIRYTLFLSVIASIGMNFLMPPLGNFDITKTRLLTALAAFLVVGITASRLSERTRAQGRVANLLLYQRHFGGYLHVQNGSQTPVQLKEKSSRLPRNDLAKDVNMLRRSMARLGYCT